MLIIINIKGASSTQLGVLATVTGLPWSFKILYGLLSDSVPILGYKRKPYFLIGWIIYIIASLWLALLVEASILATILGNFLMSCGLLLADVCTDTMCVERAKLESDEVKGTLQSAGYTYRAVGMIIGAVLGAILFNKDVWGIYHDLFFLLFLSRLIFSYSL